MLSVVKYLTFIVISLLASSVSAREVRVLVIGEGAAANCNAYRFPAVPGVYEVTKNSAQKLAHDPLELADCDGGSVWMPLGSEMIRTKFADKVTFASVAVARAQVRDWQPGGAAYKKLQMFFRNVGAESVKFDYAIWYQGYSDLGTGEVAHFNDLRRVLRAVSLNLQIDKWVIAQGAGCGVGARAESIKSAQLQISKNPILNRFPGPDVDRLDRQFYNDGCKLNKEGQIELGKQWLEAIKRADVESQKYAKESLLYFFR